MNWKSYIIFISFLMLININGYTENNQSKIDSLLKSLNSSTSKKEKANIYNLLRREYIFQGSNYNKALECAFQSIKIYEELKQDSDVFILNGNIANIYYLQKDYNTTLEYLNKANKYYNNDDYLCYLYSLVYENTGKYQLSLSYAKKCIQSSNNISRIGYAMQIIGTIYEKTNKLDSALIWYLKSNTIFKDLQNESGIREGYASIGDVFYKLKNYKEALRYENKSLFISMYEDDLPSICQTEKTLSQIYNDMGNCQKSYTHFKNYISLQDSLTNENHIKQTVRIEDNFKFEKEKEVAKIQQDKRDSIQKEELKRKQMQRNWFIGGSIFLMFFSGFIFKSYRKSKKQHEIIYKQKKLVDEKQKEITDNINYAAKIQKAILPSDEYINKNLPENFLIYRGKNIVSGDFYWAYKNGTNVYYAVGDCTSHGPSAAMLTMIVSSLLNEIVIERGITSPEQVLNMLREEIIKSLNKEGTSEERKEGCDLSFIKLNGLKLECALANNPIYIVRNNNLIELKSDRFPIGKYTETILPFTLKTFDLEKHDIIYSASDGCKDQFSEKTNKKLMSKKFKEWLIEISSLPMNEAKLKLEQLIDNWIGKSEQTDDITILSVKITE